MTTVIKVLELGDTVIFKFPYNGDAVGAFQQLPSAMVNRSKGLGWDSEKKVWIFPIESFHIIESILDQTHENLYWKFVQHEGEL